jgi:hypothetical protein
MATYSKVLLSGGTNGKQIKEGRYRKGVSIAKIAKKKQQFK